MYAGETSQSRSNWVQAKFKRIVAVATNPTIRAALKLFYAMYTYRTARWFQTVANNQVHRHAYRLYLTLLIAAQGLAFLKVLS